MIYLFILLADLYLFFILYVASMAMMRAHSEGKLNGWLWALCVPFVAVSLVYDFIHNVTLFTIFYGEPPKELLVTQRFKRHYKQPTFRGKLTRWIASTFLDPFDHTGFHLD